MNNPNILLSKNVLKNISLKQREKRAATNGTQINLERIDLKQQKQAVKNAIRYTVAPIRPFSTRICSAVLVERYDNELYFFEPYNLEANS